MKEELPANHFRLAFDPFKPTGEDGPKTVLIMQHEQARALFLFVKARYLTSQYFHDDCLRLGKLIERHMPMNLDELRGILCQAKDPSIRQAFVGFFGNDEEHSDPMIDAIKRAKLKEPNEVFLEVLQRKKSIIIEIMP